ncbi:MAG: hypothetical protein ACI3T9_02365 [Romboutsia timonensis]
MDENTKDLSEIKERLVKIETILTVKFDNVASRVDKLEDNQKWVTRSIVGLIIAAVVGTILINS